MAGCYPVASTQSHQPFNKQNKSSRKVYAGDIHRWPWILVHGFFKLQQCSWMPRASLYQPRRSISVKYHHPLLIAPKCLSLSYEQCVWFGQTLIAHYENWKARSRESCFTIVKHVFSSCTLQILFNSWNAFSITSLWSIFRATLPWHIYIFRRASLFCWILLLFSIFAENLMKCLVFVFNYWALVCTPKLISDTSFFIGLNVHDIGNVLSYYDRAKHHIEIWNDIFCKFDSFFLQCIGPSCSWIW